MDTVQQNAFDYVEIRPNGTINLNEVTRHFLEKLLNTLMDEQAQELGVSRNGYRERSLDTCVGTIVLRIPKLRQGSYFPEDIIARWSRTDTALASLICDVWVAGNSTRKLDKLAADLGVESMSRSRVSRLCAALDAEVAELRSCDLSYTTWPYLWLDATYVPCREAGAARSVALACAVACNAQGKRRIIGIETIDTESYQSWRDFLLSLRGRGLSGVRLVISDAHEGLLRAIREVCIGAAWQRCIAHLERNVAERCRRKDIGAASVSALKTAFSASDPELVRAGYRRATELLRKMDPKGASLLEDAEAAALCYLDFPVEHRLWIRTNNIQERLNAEIKRRTRVVCVFPSTASLIRLVGAMCCDQNDAWELDSHFIDARSLIDDYEKEVKIPEETERQRHIRLVEEAFDRKLKVA